MGDELRWGSKRGLAGMGSGTVNRLIGRRLGEKCGKWQGGALPRYCRASAGLAKRRWVRPHAQQATSSGKSQKDTTGKGLQSCSFGIDMLAYIN